VPAAARPKPDPRREEDVARVTADPVPGRSLVTKRAIRDLVRSATLSVYGVSGFAGGGPFGRILERLGLAQPGLRLELGDRFTLDLQLTVAYGLPIAEVARQVEAAVRYTLRHAISREPDAITIRIGRLRHEHGIAPAADAASGQPGASDLAGSGTDAA
jgi:uncharacterized alkaline shock family protein YloU